MRALNRVIDAAESWLDHRTLALVSAGALVFFLVAQFH